MKVKIKGKVIGNLAGKGLVAAATALVLFVMMAFTGCQSADPSARVTRADYGDLCVAIHGNANNVTFDLGDGAVSDASGGGDSQTSTPTLTPTVTTKAAAAWGASSAANEGSPGQAGDFISSVGKLIRIFTGSGESLSSAEAAAIRECVDGNCSD